MAYPISSRVLSEPLLSRYQLQHSQVSLEQKMFCQQHWEHFRRRQRLCREPPLGERGVSNRSGEINPSNLRMFSRGGQTIISG
jgi:hypothetical protein